MIDPLYDNPDLSSGTVLKKGRFLNRMSVRMKLTTDAETLFKLMNALQKPGRYLAVTDFDAVREDLTSDLMKVGLVATALVVDRGSPLEEGGEDGGGW